jgi:selenocysteine-specific elongation factor
MIVGTAGHIDHGKTSLVRALTGVDTDRLAEEKARGITIELGFAYWPRPSGQVVGFVDVPGHERLVHTMLAGATGIDLVLLVVAADDGVMPQTREHLAILDLLGLERGIVVMAKCDLADEARRREVEGQIRAATAGTGLAEAPVLAVSAVTGEGLGELAAALDDALVASPPRPGADGRFRLTVDRVFSLAGAGTVVTGTVVSGAVRVGDQVMVSPAGHSARVRSIHAQNRLAERGAAGDRCAIALVGPDISTTSVPRGSVVLEPSLHNPTRRLDATVTLLAGERKPLGQWTPVRVHHGPGETLGRLVPLREAPPIAPGESDFAQLVLEAPVAVAVGDRYVLRDISATRTIGGGRIVDLSPPERRRRTPERRDELAALADADVLASLTSVLAGPRGHVDLEAFFRDRAAAADTPAFVTEALDLVVITAGPLKAGFLPQSWASLRTGAVEALTRFHAENRDAPGIGPERLRKALSPRLSPQLFPAALQRMASDGALVLDRSWVRLPTHSVKLSSEDERTWNRIAKLLGGSERFRPPRVRDVADALRLSEAQVRRLAKLAAKRGEVDEIAPDHFFLQAAVVEMADIVRALAKTDPDGKLTVIQFRDRLDNGRKVAIHILEFFDRQGLTMRRGDFRTINPHKAGLFTRPSGAPAPKMAPAAGRSAGAAPSRRGA